MKLSAIQSQTLRVPVTLGDAVLNVEYCPARITARRIQEMVERSRAAEEQAKAGVVLPGEESPVAVMVAEVLSGWDLTDDDGKPVPITAAVLADELGYHVTNAIWSAIQESMNPNSPSGAAA